MQDRYLELVRGYQKDLEKISQDLKPFSYTTVFNADLLEYKISDIIGITVMDNPGITELEEGRYLIGSAGKGFNKVISSIDGMTREDNLIILNKSSIHTKATLDLNKMFEDERLAEIFLKEQETTFEFIRNVQELCDCYIMVHGYPAYFKNGKACIANHKGGRPLVRFFQLLFEYFSDKSDKVLFYHHSSYGSLEKQIRAFEEENNILGRSLDMFVGLGRKNSDGFFD